MLLSFFDGHHIGLVHTDIPEAIFAAGSHHWMFCVMLSVPSVTVQLRKPKIVYIEAACVCAGA